MEVQSKSKRKRNESNVHRATKKKRIEREEVYLPWELLEKIWLGHITEEKEQEGLWGLLLVYRMVCKEWRAYLEQPWKDSLRTTSSFNSFPMVAARFGWTNLLPWAISQGWSQRNGAMVMAAAAAKGKISVLEWFGKDMISKTITHAAIKGGNENALVWCYENTRGSVHHRLRNDAMRRAAVVGSLPLLQVSMKDFCPASKQGHLLAIAASNGHLDLVQWMLEEFKLNKRFVYQKAARQGHLHILEWLYSIHGDDDDDKVDWMNVAENASAGNQQEVMQWVRYHWIYEPILNLAK
jgi:hypothetical protein